MMKLNLDGYLLGRVFKTGFIAMFAGSVANKPEGWLVCDGSAVSRTLYKDLFDIIGTAYGAGDGTTTFNLPNFSGKWAGGNGNGYLSAGLPNISGSGRGVGQPNDYTGAMKSGTYSINGIGGYSNTYGYPFTFKASNSNAIYGAASTVQPPTCQTLFLIKY